MENSQPLRQGCVTHSGLHIHTNTFLFIASPLAADGRGQALEISHSGMPAAAPFGMGGRGLDDRAKGRRAHKTSPFDKPSCTAHMPLQIRQRQSLLRQLMFGVIHTHVIHTGRLQTRVPGTT